MRTGRYIEANPEGSHALAGRLAFLRHEKRTVARARRHMLEAAYLAALEIRNLGTRAKHQDAAKVVTSYARLLIPVLVDLTLSGMSVAARLGSYGIEKAELARSSGGSFAVRSKHTRELNRLTKSFPRREFNGRDLEGRCEAAVMGYIGHMASAAAYAFTESGSEKSASAVEEYAAFGLKDKPRARDAAPDLPDNPGWVAEQLVISELNYAYNAGIAASGKLFTGYIGSRWMLSPLHLIEDICDEYTNEDRFGMGAGVYPKGYEPDYPHPNCRCWLAPMFTGGSD